MKKTTGYMLKKRCCALMQKYAEDEKFRNEMEERFKNNYDEAVKYYDNMIEGVWKNWELKSKNYYEDSTAWGSIVLFLDQYGVFELRKENIELKQEILELKKMIIKYQDYINEENK